MFKKVDLFGNIISEEDMELMEHYELKKNVHLKTISKLETKIQKERDELEKIEKTISIIHNRQKKVDKCNQK